MTFRHILVAFGFVALAAGPGCYVEVPVEGDDDAEQEADTFDQDVDGTAGSGCVSDADCSQGFACSFTPGTCGDVGGECQPVLEDVAADCTAGVVCGCNGVDYANACDAWDQGVSVWLVGTCADGVLPGTAPDTEPNSADDPEDEEIVCGGELCAPGQFCFNDGACGTDTGTCRDPNGICTGSASVVCGCDGQSYSSLCDAVSAGVSVAHDGGC